MVKAAKAPAKKTSPVIYVGIAAAVVAAYILLAPGDAPSKPATTSSKSKFKSSKSGGQFLPADYDALNNPFPPVTLAAVDAFNPLVKKKVVRPLPPTSLDNGPQGIPVAFTGGEPNWYFTGCPSTDGVRTALFENTTSGESVYVKAGDAFKAARVQNVDVSTVMLVGPNGAAATVPILAFGQTPGGTKGAVAALTPLPVPTGAIGGPLRVPGTLPVGGPQTITLANGQTIQLPSNVASGNGNDLNVTPDTNSGNGRRRRRNRNFGDSTNGF